MPEAEEDGNGFPETCGSSVSAETARMQLVRILNSNTFQQSDILKRFLEHVVQHSIARESTELKEYTIGVDILRRGESFDPRTDTIVRVHARRLRAKLKSYYDTEGQQDPIIIEIPKGRYEARFTPASIHRNSNLGLSGEENGAQLHTAAGGVRPQPSSQPVQPEGVGLQVGNQTTISDEEHMSRHPGTAISRTVVLSLALALAGAIYVLSHHEPSTKQSTWKITPITSMAGPEWWPSLSPDGSLLAFSHVESGSLDLFVTPVRGGEPIRVTDSPADDLVPRWSPDGRHLAYLSDEGRGENVYLIAPLSGTRTKVATTGVPHMTYFVESWQTLGAQPWSPDGQKLLFSRLQPSGEIALWKVDIATGEETQLTNPPVAARDLQASWSFDGKWIAFVRHGKRPASLWLLPGQGGEGSALLSDEYENAHPSFSTEGDRLVFQSNRAGQMNIWELDIDTHRLRQLTAGAGRDAGPAVGYNGQLVYCRPRQQQTLYLLNLQDGRERRLTSRTHRNYSPRISREERKVVYQSNRSGNFDLWELDLDTGSERQLTTHSAADHGPDWSPDGSEVTFVSDRTGEFHIWVMNVRSGVFQQLTPQGLPSQDRAAWRVPSGPRWSPDGKVIGYVAQGKDDSALWVVDRAGGDPHLAVKGVFDFAWYRDSGHILYTPAGLEANELRARALETGRETVLFQGAHRELAVAADGSTATFGHGISTQLLDLYALRLGRPDAATGLPRPLGKPRRLTEEQDVWHPHNGSLSANGQLSLYTRDIDDADVYLIENYE